MPSFQKNYYCKNCKSNVVVDENGKCKKCGSTRLNVSQSVRFRYITKEGKEVQKRLGGFSTKKEANDAYIKFMSEAKIYSKLEKDARDLTFLELYEEYKSFVQSRIKKSSYQTFTQRAEKYVLNYFNKQKVVDITPKMILNWQNTIENFSYSYKSHIRTILGNVLKYADKYYEIPNQMSRVDNFKNLTPKQEMQIWTPQQFESVMDHVKNFEYKVFFSALFYTGARRGEFMATSWDDWDLDKNILIINKTATKKLKDINTGLTQQKPLHLLEKSKSRQILLRL